MPTPRSAAVGEEHAAMGGKVYETCRVYEKSL
jgi:hypothetical protein